MGNATKKLLDRIGAEFRNCPRSKNGMPLLMWYCHGCTKNGTNLCHCTTRDVYVQGAWPWDCMFCDQYDGEPRTYCTCPILHSGKTENAYDGCPKMSADGKGMFCQHAVRRIPVYRDDSNGPCEHYEFNRFFADSQDTISETYMFALNHIAVKRLVYDNGWLTVGDMLRNIRRPMLDKVSANKGAATRAWRELCRWSDLAGYYLSEDGDSLMLRQPDEQTVHVHRLRLYKAQLMAEEDRAKRDERCKD